MGREEGGSIPGFNLLSNPQPSRQILRKDRGAETVLGIICNLNRLFLALDHNQRDSRPERFRLVNIHVFRNTVYHNRPHPGLGMFFRVDVTGQDFGALGKGLLDQFLVLLHRWRVDQDGSRGFVTVGLVHGGLERFAEFFGNGGMDEDAFGGHAYLATVGERAPGTDPCGFLDVGVFEDDGGCFAAEFHEHWFEEFPGLGGDDAARGGTARKVDLLYVGVFDDRARHFGGVLGTVEDDV